MQVDRCPRPSSGCSLPWDVAFLPDGRSLVTERPGRVRMLDEDGDLQRQVVARVPTRARGEGGLLGIAIDPDFAQGRRFVYLYVTTADGMQVQRWRMRGDRLRRDGVVLDGIRAGVIHDSGRLAFGPDERLYVLTGDAGQGKLAHVVPQGLAWQPGTGRLFTTEHGPSGFDGPSGDDEVNVVDRGDNFGWPEVRGADHGRFDAPAFVWSKTVAPSGAAFVTRPGLTWTGDLLVAALKGTVLIRLRADGASVTGEQRLLDDRYGRLRVVPPRA